MPQSFVKGLTVSLTCLAIALMLLVGFAGWPSADDFGNFYNMRTFGPFGYAVKQYGCWDGRLFNYVLMSLYINTPRGAKFDMMLAVLCFAAIAWMSSAFWAGISGKGMPRLYYFLLMLLSLWAGMIPILPETLYWAAGAIPYTIVPMLGMAWAYFMMKTAGGGRGVPVPIFTYPLFMLFSFFLGTASLALSPALLVLGAAIFAAAGNRWSYAYGAVFCAGIIAGTIVMAAAPGNYARAGGIGVDAFGVNVLDAAKNYFMVAGSYLASCKYFFPLSAAAAAAAAFYERLYPAGDAQGGDGQPIETGKSGVIAALGFLGAGMASILPFSLIPDFAAGRTGVFFFFFTNVFVWFAVKKLIVRFYGAGILGINGLVRIFVYAVPVIMCILVVLPAGFDIYYGTKIQRQLMERDRMLSGLVRNAGERSLRLVAKVKPVAGKKPGLIHFDDIKPYPADFRNEHMSLYYRLGAVVLDNK